MSRGSLILLQAGSGEEVWRFEPPASHGCVLSSVHTATSSDASVVVGCSSSASQRLSRVYELTGSDGSVLHTYDVSSSLDGAHEVRVEYMAWPTRQLIRCNGLLVSPGRSGVL